MSRRKKNVVTTHEMLIFVCRGKRTNLNVFVQTWSGKNILYTACAYTCIELSVLIIYVLFRILNDSDMPRILSDLPFRLPVCTHVFNILV